MDALKPAAALAAAASKPYPNDSTAYRDARTALLAEEIELRRHIERVAARRRALPLGGEPPDYRFTDENGRAVPRRHGHPGARHFAARRLCRHRALAGGKATGVRA
ncbi:DUF899 family protein [Polaromonas sp. YR568]|uniref:DUF899 family protein n=1 Tax=Polaromonas sp. YR568 TaxID=1855301 RepID=UPI00398C1939